MMSHYDIMLTKGLENKRNKIEVTKQYNYPHAHHRLMEAKRFTRTCQVLLIFRMFFVRDKSS